MTLDEAFMEESAFEIFTGEEGGNELNEVSQAALEHLESIIDYPYHPNKNGVNGTSEDVESAGNGGH
ncbi:hypothetical protein C8R48DRAFT_777299 [Suillus tomentosus]|nr:hypothetical protein C8R48DRAFT_777299 [Suillus tomentosus]